MSRPIRNTLRVVAALILLVLAAPLAVAQFRTSIQGTVTDPSGAVIPNATLTLLDKQTNQTVTSHSDSSGIYNFNALPPSQFRLTATMSGFATKVMDDLKLIPEQPNSVNVELTVGESSTTVTVTSNQQVPGLDTQTANLVGVVTEQQITHLPSFGRDPLSLTQLAPGTIADGGQGSGGGVRNLPGTNQGGTTAGDGIFKVENGPQFVANGSQTNTNSVSVDGINTASAVWGGTSIVTPTEESIDNVKVVTNGYDAEFGRSSGGNVQVTSKGGTNAFHGSLFFKADRPGLNAYQRWNGVNSVGAPAAGKTPLNRGLSRDTQKFNQWGGSVGGPIWRDKLFFFFAYETLRAKTVSFNTAWFETPALLSRAPANSIASKFTTYSGIGVQSLGLTGSNACSSAGLVEGPFCHAVADGLDIGSPLTTPRGTYDPTRSTSSALQPGVGSGLDGVADIANYAVYTGNSRKAEQYYGRIDAQVTSKDRLSAMTYWMPVKSNLVNGPARGINQWLNDRKQYAFTALWNHVFSPSLINEARANAAGWRWNEVTSNPNTPFGLPKTSFADVRGFLPVEISSFSPSDPSIFNQWIYGYQDIMTKVWGRHTTKFGAQVNRVYYLNQSVGNARLSYNFGSLWNFLNDAPYSESGNFNPVNGTPTPNRLDERSNMFGGFVQDSWKVTSTFTATLGIRYDYLGPLYDKAGNLPVVELGSGSALVSGLRIRKGGDLYSSQKGNFGPQLGFNWNPDIVDRRFVLRGGFGINYNQNELAITTGGGSNPGNILGFNFCCRTGAGNTSTGSFIQEVTSSDLNNPFGFPSNPNAVTSYDANGLPLTGTVGVTAFDQNVKTIQTMHYSLDTQYDLGHQWVATLGYQGSVSHHLLLQQDMNVIAAAQGFALNPRVSRVGMYSNKGNANYNAMVATVKHNFARSYQLEGQYTWSKSMDNGSQPYYQDVYAQQLLYSYGRSDYNVKNSFRVFGMYQPEFFKGKNYFMHALVDGFTITGIFNWHTGFPWTPTYSVNGGNFFYANSGQNTLRPAAYFGNAGHDLSNESFKSGPNSSSPAGTPLTKNFANGAQSYFALPTGGQTAPTFPDIGVVPPAPGIDRNAFDGPGYRALDGSITKGFHLPKLPVLGENAIFEFRIDAFNVLNNLNISGVNNNIGSVDRSTGVFTPNVNFGQGSGGLGARIMDMQARFSF